MPKPTVLFICVHNSVRSPMAEGLLRTRYGDHYEVYSAGAKPSGVNPLAVEVLDEVGIDISDHRSESVDRYADRPPDYVATVCDMEQDDCLPLSAQRQNFHRHFEDPGTVEGSDEEKRAAFRRIRDEIEAWIKTTFDPDLLLQQ